MSLLGGLRRKRLGYVPDVPDKRDHNFAEAGFAPRVAPISLLEFAPDTLDQGPTSSCVAHAVAAGIRLATTMRQGVGTALPARGWLYWWARRYRYARPTDRGCQIRDCVKGAVSLGYPAEHWAPWDPRKVNEHPDSKAMQHAADLRGAKGYYRIESSSDPQVILERIGAALHNGWPVVFGQWIDREFLDPNGPAMVGPPKNNHGRHAMLCTGIRSDGSVNVRNSWGNWWRNNGSVIMSPESLLHWRDIWAICPREGLIHA